MTSSGLISGAEWAIQAETGDLYLPPPQPYTMDRELASRPGMEQSFHTPAQQPCNVRSKQCVLEANPEYASDH